MIWRVVLVEACSGRRTGYECRFGNASVHPTIISDESAHIFNSPSKPDTCFEDTHSVKYSQVTLAFILHPILTTPQAIKLTEKQ